MNETTPPLAIVLTTSQRFEIEKMDRVIDGTTDVEALRKLSKQLHQAWQVQKATSRWLIDENCKAMQAEQDTRMRQARQRRNPIKALFLDYFKRNNFNANDIEQ
jgi:acetolactate synthase small subunit